MRLPAGQELEDFVRALPAPSANPVGSQKATDMDANEFITHVENLPLSA